MTLHPYTDGQEAAINFIQAENFIELMIQVLMHKNGSQVSEH